MGGFSKNFSLDSEATTVQRVRTSVRAKNILGVQTRRMKAGRFLFGSAKSGTKATWFRACNKIRERGRDARAPDFVTRFSRLNRILSPHRRLHGAFERLRAADVGAVRVGGIRRGGGYGQLRR